MAGALLGIFVTAVAAVDAQVAADLIDPPLSIHASLRGEQVEHDGGDSTSSTPTGMALLHQTLQSNSTLADSLAVDGYVRKPAILGRKDLQRPKRFPIEVRKRPLIWLHVHKVAGTFMCNMAKRNHETVERPENNCNWMGHDGFRLSGKPSVRRSCFKRAKMFRTEGFTYGQIEREVHDDEVCDKFSYGIMFREPVGLAQSLMNYELWYQVNQEHNDYENPFLNFPPDVAAWMKEKIDAKAVPGNQLAPWAWVDNFQTRFLANAFDVPAGQITRKHLAKARGFLEKHDVTVSVLEDLSSTGAQLFQDLGWTWDEDLFHNQTASLDDILRNNPSQKTEQRSFTPEEKDYLQSLNRYDLELYHGARDRVAPKAN
jgi:hypothetical protein